MKRILLITIMSTLLFLAGCAPRNVRNYYPEEKFISYGNVGEVKTALVNDSIIHIQKEIITDALEVPNHVEYGNTVIPKGIYLKIGEDKDNLYFELQTMEGRPFTADNMVFRDGYLVYNKRNKKYYPGGPGIIAALASYDGGIIRKGIRTKVRDKDYLYRSLAYGGSRKHYVSFIYTEGHNTQRMTHDVTASRIFTYQGAKIEIIKYDEDSLTYRILSKIDQFD